MALFTDGGPASIADLKRYDSSAEDLAREVNIDLDAKLSVAAEEVGQEIFQFLLFHTTPQFSGANFLTNLSPSEATRQKLGLTDVVVTASLRRWHALKALESLYRDAYGSDVTDRYRLKWEQYEKLAREAAEYAFGTGIGVARTPVPKAALPVITSASPLPDAVNYAIRITWVNNYGAEGAPSDVWQAALGSGDQVSVAAPTPDAVVAWNLYIGQLDGTPTLQNDSPMPIDAAWTSSGASPRQSRAVIEGQSPDYLVIERHILPRG